MALFRRRRDRPRFGTLYENRAGNVGLATSGSGDALAARIGPIGYLTRELLDEIPALLARLDRRPRG